MKCNSKTRTQRTNRNIFKIKKVLQRFSMEKQNKIDAKLFQMRLVFGKGYFSS